MLKRIQNRDAQAHPYTDQASAPSAPLISWCSGLKDFAPKDIPFLQFLKYIKEGEGTAELYAAKKLIPKILRAKTNDKQQALKKGLPFAYISCTLFEGERTQKNLKNHSGLICIDVDAKDHPALFADPEILKSILAMVRQLPCYVADWASVRLGKAIVFKIRPEDHLKAYLSLEDFFKKLGITTDPLCKNVNRFRYWSPDPDLHYNPLLEKEFSKIHYYAPAAPQQHASSAPATRQQRPSNTPAAPQHQTDEEAAIAYVLELAEKKGYAFEDGRRHQYTVWVASLLNQFGVRLASALDALEGQTENSDNPDHHTRTLKDLYRRYGHQFGKKNFQPNPPAPEPGQGESLVSKKINLNDQTLSPELPAAVATEPLPEPGQGESLVSKKINLNDQTLSPELPAAVATEPLPEPGQGVTVKRYLSEIRLPEERKLIVNVPTNAGKTYYFAREAAGKRILLVPTVPLALQVQKQYGVKAIFEGVHVNKTDEVLVSTYESLPKILEKLNVAAYALWMDEAHNLIQASSTNFRNKILQVVTESFQFFDRVVLLSGSWIPTTAEPLKDFAVFNVLSAGKKNGTFNVIPTTNKLKSLSKRIQLHPEGYHVIYLNNKRKAEATAKILSELAAGRFIAIHAKNKNKPDQKQIIESGLLPTGICGIVITDVFKEGVSLLDEKPFFVHLLGSADSVTSEQVINRVRKVVPMTFWYVDPEAKKSNQVTTEAIRLKFEQTLKERAFKAAAAWEALRELSCDPWRLIKYDKKGESLFQDKYNRQLVLIPKERTEEIKINHLGIANSAFQFWVDTERNNPEMYLQNMQERGYAIEHVPEENEEDQSLLNAQKVNVAEIKEMEEQQIGEILAEFEAGGKNHVEEVDSIEQDCPLRLELAARWLFLYSRVAEVPDITAILLKNSAKKAWNRYRTQLENQIYINTQLDKKRATNALIRQYIATFEIGKSYTPLEIWTLTRALLYQFESTRNAADSLTKTKATQDLGLFFQIEKTGGRQEQSYQIIKQGALDIVLKGEKATA